MHDSEFLILTFPAFVGEDLQENQINLTRISDFSYIFSSFSMVIS